MFSKIYLDTAPIIYFLENNPMYALKVQDFIQSAALTQCRFATSVLTNLEYLPKPIRENKQDLVIAYNSLKQLIGLQFIAADEEISMLSVQLRVKYAGLKPLDSVHLASAICSGCDAFFTNDKQLKQVSEISVIYLSEL